MRARAGVGWQYALADLSLILFMVCAAALAREQKAHATRPAPPPIHAPRPAPVQAVALADPVAVWRAGPDMPSLAEWLASQSIDRRQRLTIVAHYADGRAQLAFTRAQNALQAQPKLPPSTRIVVEPALVDDLSATLTWDVGGA